MTGAPILILLVITTFLITQSSTNQFKKPAVYQITQPFEHTECPIWDARKNILYFVDIHRGNIFSYDYPTGQLRNISLYGDVAPVIPSAKDENLLLAGVNRSIVAVKWDGKGNLEGHKVLTTVADDKPTSRFNDGKADQAGRLWIGTMGYETQDGNLTRNDGSLYMVHKQNIKNPLPIITPVDISNGLAWNAANNKFYYIDTPTHKVMVYDYDSVKGAISNPQTAFDLRETGIGGAPDGMTIDKDGNLWIALYHGGSVIQVDPSKGKILQQIAIPAECVTSVTFGGPNYEVLFVTTSKYSLDATEKLAQPAAGSLFAITDTGSSGLPTNFADIDQV